MVNTQSTAKRANAKAEHEKSLEWRSKHSRETLERLRLAVRNALDESWPTDAILPIAEGFMRLIADGRKNYEYRFKLADGVEWLWFYVRAPTAAITHVALTGPPKNPGGVKNDGGVGNQEFNKGMKPGRKGYPIRKLYELYKPISRAELIDKYGVVSANGYMIPKGRLVLAREIWLNVALIHNRMNEI